jgi:hypothetical protein
MTTKGVRGSLPVGTRYRTEGGYTYEIVAHLPSGRFQFRDPAQGWTATTAWGHSYRYPIDEAEDPNVG